MSEATNTPPAEPVRLLCTSGDAPVMLDGALTQAGEDLYTLRASADAAALSVGNRVILNFTASDRARMTGTVKSLDHVDSGGFRIEIADTVSRERDKRDFPRLFAGLPIRYRVVTDAEFKVDQSAVDAWVATGDASEGTWHTPDPFMNFSVGGLRFDGLTSLKMGSSLLIDLAVSDHGERWASTATVIRVWDPETPEADTQSVAVAFVHLPEDAREALSDLTLRIQDSLL